ncbi:MAG: ATP-binding protein [Methanomassiliicoccaceae archaeon]|nr:ATP-binding protein [Methanomassiliicoccaceae archaeon]
MEDHIRKFREGGRGRELRSLEKLYNREGFTFAVIYGRRRVGKTSLINEFIRRDNKKAIQFTATENTNAVNLSNFSKSIFSVFPRPPSLGGLPSWEGAFDYIVEQAKEEKIILAIDEYPYLVKAYPPLSSEIQRYIDLTLQDIDIMLILCGSSMSFMENQVLGYESPLYGRRTAQYKIRPLDYYDSAEFFEGTSQEDKLLGYAVTGGIPLYLNIVSEGDTVAAGIEEAFFATDGFLFEEPYNLLKQELREPAVYNAIIGTIAGGSTKLNEIADKIKEDKSKVAKYISTLIDLGILEREVSMFAKNSRTGVYRIKDNMYRFWYRFVWDNIGLVESEHTHIYKEKVEPFIPDFMGHVFEDVCVQYLTRLNAKGRLPFTFDSIGRWWGGNPVTKKETEIDVVASSGNKMIVGECKWKSKETGVDVYRDLRNKAAMFADKDIYYFIFSKSGFTKELMDEAKADGRLTLAGLDDLFTL